jgi:hypothetical protein
VPATFDFAEQPKGKHEESSVTTTIDEMNVLLKATAILSTA